MNHIILYRCFGWRHTNEELMSLQELSFVLKSQKGGGGGRGAIAQSVERATSSKEVLGSISEVAALF